MTDPNRDVPFLIVKTGRAVPEARRGGQDFEDWFADGLGRERFEFRTVRVDEGETLPEPDPARLAGALVTGSPAMVSDRADWSEATAAWLAEAHRGGLPLLGVCYGHQLLAHALGGEVGPNPEGRRMGRFETRAIDPDDALLAPFAPACAFHVSHFEAVLRLPDGARVVGRADHDPHHALHFGGNSWGVQFHPEFDRETMRAYIEARAEVLDDEGQDPVALREAVDGPHHGPKLLRRFGDLAILAHTSANA
ncbi:MAG: glutamine amidotransferase [Wenzhouxiangellaceae bacterium]|nr:glutamine amidotransferase [Wenzhouxiangellaceae bacterium]